MDRLWEERDALALSLDEAHEMISNALEILTRPGIWLQRESHAIRALGGDPQAAFTNRFNEAEFAKIQEFKERADD